MIETLQTIAILGVFPAFAMSVVVIVFLIRLYNKVSGQPYVYRITHDKIYLTKLPETVRPGMKIVSNGDNAIVAVVEQPKVQRGKYGNGCYQFELELERLIPKVRLSYSKLLARYPAKHNDNHYVLWNPAEEMIIPNGEFMIENLRLVINKNLLPGEFVITKDADLI